LTVTGPLPTDAGLLPALEDLLVAEFRACGDLLENTREERLHLGQGNLAGLTAVLDQKEKILGELDRLEQRREAALAHWGARPTPGPEAGSEAEAAARERLGRLREGLLALVQRQQELARGNRLLAEASLERVKAMQAFIGRLGDAVEGYRPPGAPANADQATSLAFDHWA
jgi:flagellar biosynthesis/type III secretory pathway chaperone